MVDQRCIECGAPMEGDVCNFCGRAKQQAPKRVGLNLNKMAVLILAIASILTIGIFSFIFFFYIGHREKYRTWTIFGIVYLLPFFIINAFENLAVIIVLASLVHTILVCWHLMKSKN